MRSMRSWVPEILGLMGVFLAFLDISVDIVFLFSSFFLTRLGVSATFFFFSFELFKEYLCRTCVSPRSR